MTNLTQERENALRIAAVGIGNMLRAMGFDDVNVRCTHDFETGQGYLMVKVPVYEEEQQ